MSLGAHVGFGRHLLCAVRQRQSSSSGGAGAASRHSIGTGVFFGMLVATLVGVFFIPLFFVAIRSLSERGLVRRSAGAVVPPTVAVAAEGD